MPFSLCTLLFPAGQLHAPFDTPSRKQIILGILHVMKLKASLVWTLLLVGLLLPLDATACFSRGKLNPKTTDSEVYEIDYRGPETHTYIPPPSRSGGRPKMHHQTSMACHKSRSSRGHRIKVNGNKIHG